MKLEEQVCSLELAKKLKELGLKQESIFGWLHFNNGESELVHFCDGVLIPPTNYAAFTVAELGEMLPEEIWDEEDNGFDFLCTYPIGAHWACSYRRYNGDSSWSSTYVEKARSEADARAKMLIYLIEQGQITV